LGRNERLAYQYVYRIRKQNYLGNQNLIRLIDLPPYKTLFSEIRKLSSPEALQDRILVHFDEFPIPE
jgi:hypothetical protein